MSINAHQLSMNVQQNHWTENLKLNMKVKYVIRHGFCASVRSQLAEDLSQIEEGYWEFDVTPLTDIETPIIGELTMENVSAPTIGNLSKWAYPT